MVGALIAHRRQRAAEQSLKASAPKIEFYTLGDLLASSREDLVARDIAADPIGHGLRQQIKRVGRLLGARLSFEKFYQLIERVCERDPPNAGKRMSILDSALDCVRTRDGNIWAA